MGGLYRAGSANSLDVRHKPPCRTIAPRAVDRSDRRIRCARRQCGRTRRGSTSATRATPIHKGRDMAQRKTLAPAVLQAVHSYAGQTVHEISLASPCRMRSLFFFEHDLCLVGSEAALLPPARENDKRASAPFFLVHAFYSVNRSSDGAGRWPVGRLALAKSRIWVCNGENGTDRICPFKRCVLSALATNRTKNF